MQENPVLFTRGSKIPIFTLMSAIACLAELLQLTWQQSIWSAPNTRDSLGRLACLEDTFQTPQLFYQKNGKHASFSPTQQAYIDSL